MKKIKTYFVKRGSYYIWLGCNINPQSDDIVVEERIITVAEEGKVLVNKDGDIIGLSYWNKEKIELQEIDEPAEETEKIIDEEGGYES